MAFVVFHFLILVVLLPFFFAASADGNVPVGAVLTANVNSASTWLSSSGDFAFGFRQLDNSEDFLLSIWFDRIPEQTIVWYANGDNLAPVGSKLELTADRGLLLTTPQGKEIWRSNITKGQVSHGVMLDTGCFALESNNSDVLWRSFDYPTDTLLPTQVMVSGGILFSRKTATNFSHGRFQLRFLDDGNLVLNPINLETSLPYEPYYVSGTSDAANVSNSGVNLTFSESGALYIVKRNGLGFFFTTVNVPSTDFYHRAILNPDGVFAQYTYPKTSTGSRNWTIIWGQPDDICIAINGTLGSGACGYNSICSLDEFRRPICACPKGYSLLDPSDEHGSCKPDFQLSCEQGQGSIEDLYGILELNNTDWSTSDYDQLKPLTEAECKNSCLHDCLCDAAIFRNNSCWKKKLPLSNGRTGSNVDGKAFVKTKNGYDPRFPNSLERGSQSNKIIAVSVPLGISIFINCSLIAAFCLTYFLIYRKRLQKTHQGRITEMETCVRCFTYEELRAATNNFKEEVGRGAVGIVYKGMVRIGCVSTMVAVKELDSVFQDGEEEFRSEVNVIGRRHHKNLVQLLGFCDEGQHRLLVYEYVSNGSSAEIIFGNPKPKWNLRTHIVHGLAKGLLYLHEECNAPIIHCDIKPQNVLLDDDFNARISDFGLAKLLAIDQSQTHTGIRGTRGYIAPEWFRRKAITTKVDVYSFGVTLLEIICCRRSSGTEIDGQKAVLVDWAYECYGDQKLYSLAEDDKEAIDDLKMLERLVKVAIWCTQEQPALRPGMRQVIHMLEGVIQVLDPPDPYWFTSEG